MDQQTNNNELHGIEKYLVDETSYNLYNELTTAYKNEIIDPSKVFVFLHILEELTYNGKEKPYVTIFKIKAKINTYNSLRVRRLLYKYLYELIVERDPFVSIDHNLMKCLGLIESERLKVDEEIQFDIILSSTAGPQLNKYDWLVAQKEVDKIEGTINKIAYLIDISTKCKQQNTSGWKPIDLKEQKEFCYKCELEIKKINAIKALQAQIAPQEVPEVNNAISSNFTNSQWVLITYYFFKYLGIEINNPANINPSSICKWLHLITGVPFTKTANSDFYNKIRKAPNIKSDERLITDLEIIKSYFESVQLSEVVKLVDNEILLARKEIPNTSKQV